MNRFRRPIPVVRRGAGEFVRGIWQPVMEPQPNTVMLGLQPATAADYEKVQANPEGRRVAALLRAYGPLSEPLNVAGEDNSNGDLVIHDGHHWLVIGKHVRNLVSSRFSHIRYLLAREIEHSDGEVVS